MREFSTQLQELLGSKESITLTLLIDKFAEKSFAILLLLLLAVPALPLPTGGVTHIFEIIGMLLALELIAGRRAVWLPKKWLTKPVPQSLQSTALPRFLKIIQWFEKLSKPRLRSLQQNRFYIRIAGLIMLVFILSAFLAPPFSGLDTLPSLGVVVISLSIIFEDIVLSIFGLILGVVGIALIFLLGSIAFSFF